MSEVGLEQRSNADEHTERRSSDRPRRSHVIVEKFILRLAGPSVDHVSLMSYRTPHSAHREPDRQEYSSDQSTHTQLRDFTGSPGLIVHSSAMNTNFVFFQSRSRFSRRLDGRNVASRFQHDVACKSPYWVHVHTDSSVSTRLISSCPFQWIQYHQIQT